MKLECLFLSHLQSWKQLFCQSGPVREAEEMNVTDTKKVEQTERYNNKVLKETLSNNFKIWYNASNVSLVNEGS